MTEPVTFFSHMVTGLLAEANHLAVDNDLVATFDLVVRSEPSGVDNRSVPRKIGFYRPCDVLGIAPAAIRRSDPAFAEHNAEFEPNYLAQIEFVAADLPWRFTLDPGTPDTRMPWVALVVLAEGEFTLEPAFRDQENSSGEKVPRLPTVRVHDTSVLPPAEQAGLWAHVQAEGERRAATARQLEALNKTSPFGLISRLVGARRLEPRTGYTAFVVPNSECGARRGLDPTGFHEHSEDVAWDSTTSSECHLPVYFSWSFATSEYGDIEALAERLKGRGLDPGTGTRPLRSGQQEYNIAPASPHRRYEGAIVSTEVPPYPEQASEITNRLADVLNWPSDLRAASAVDDAMADPKALAPPIYGSWHAKKHRVDPADPHWVNQLNTNLHLRAVAGLGAAIVRRDQEELVAEAWRQVGDVMEAQRRLCAAQLGFLTSNRLFRRSLGGLSPAALLLMTRPVHATLRDAGSLTLSAELQTTALRGVANSARLRSMLGANAVVRRYMAGDLVTEVVQTVAAAEATQGRFETEILDPAMAEVTFGDAAVQPVPGGRVRRGIASTTVLLADGADIGRLGVADPGVRMPAGTIDRGGIVGGQPGAVEPVEGLGPVDLVNIQREILESLDPAMTIPGRINALIDGVEIQSPASLCNAVLPAPEFTTPMYEPLRDLSVSYLLPGIGDIPPNTVALLQANNEFIEAYMAGLNFEMAAELLWRGYPTEMRATFFRHFWETGGQGSAIGDLVTWQASLGDNIVGSPPLIMLIRGDIVRRYRGLSIYARRAAIVDNRYVLAGDAVVPSFRADLTGDTVVLGFDNLTEDTVRGSETDHGYFFVLEESERDIRFGLDEPDADAPNGNGWNEVTWADVAPEGTDDPVRWAGPIDLSTKPTSNELPIDPAWGGAAAGMATLLFQQPFRIALHARRLLPANTQP